MHKIEENSTNIISYFGVNIALLIGTYYYYIKNLDLCQCEYVK